VNALSWISANFRTYLWALALSTAVWIAAVTSADPDEARLYPKPVPIEVVGQDAGLVIDGTLPATTELLLRAPRSVWSAIESDPESVRAILDLSGLSSGEHKRDLQIQVNARPVRIVSATPGTLTFSLEPLATRTMNVDLSLTGQPAIGYQAGDAELEPLEVIIAGAKSRVESVTRARLAVSLDGVREDIQAAFPVEGVNDRGQVVSGLTITPATVDVILPVSQQGGYRDLAVKVDVRGLPASGYRLTNISVFPPVVTVFATDPEVVNALPGVLDTLPLDISGANDDITTRLSLNLPPGISVVGEQTVLIQAGVTPIESSLRLEDERVEVLGVPAGYKVQVSPQVVDVILSGPLPLLSTLTAQDVRVVVDVGGLAPGTHQLTPKVEILISDVDVESILPATIEVVLTEPGAPTPTPRP